MHGRDGYHGTRYDGVGSDLGPQVVGLPEKVSEEVQGSAELLVARREATGELRQGFDVSAPEVVCVGHAGRVERDVVLMFGARVRVDDPGQVGSKGREPFGELWIVSRCLDEARDCVEDDLVQSVARLVNFCESGLVMGEQTAFQVVSRDFLYFLLIPHDVLFINIVNNSASTIDREIW